jgi:ribulose-5-phosphate 4-epimerase/fuculose-1-phosphate aldolase
VNGTVGGYAERYIHSAIMKAYPDVNAVVHSHSEDVLPYTVLNSISPEPVYHMAGFLGPFYPALTELCQELIPPRSASPKL